MRDPRQTIPYDSKQLRRARLLFRLVLVVLAAKTAPILIAIDHEPTTQAFLQICRAHFGLYELGTLFYLLFLVAQHEIGHALAARLVGFRLTHVRICCVVFTRENNKWRLRLNLRRILSGSVFYQLPPPVPKLRRRQTIVSAAGSAANLLTVIPAWLVVLWVRGHPQLSPIWAGAALWSMLIPVEIAFLAIFPVRELRFCSDGDRILHHWFVSVAEDANRRLWDKWRCLDDSEAALEEICRECERLYNNNPRDAYPLRVWGMALCQRVPRVSGADAKSAADRLYADAESKVSEALSLSPGDAGIAVSLVFVLVRRSRLYDPQHAARLLGRADELLATVLRKDPRHGEALRWRAHLVYERVRRMPGKESQRLLAQTVAQFEAASRSGADSAELSDGQGVLLMAQAKCAPRSEFECLMRQAKTKLAQAESRSPRSNAYNLACVCAQLGEVDECRRWLIESREPGILVSVDEMASEEELVHVRESEWFSEMLSAKGQSTRPDYMIAPVGPTVAIPQFRR